MKHFILFYVFVADMAERRPAHRASHLKLAWEAEERGELVIAGALSGDSAGAALVFQGEGPGVAERFAERDPYVKEGLVTRWWVSEWHTVVGDAAKHPTRPEDA